MQPLQVKLKILKTDYRKITELLQIGRISESFAWII